MRERGSAVVKYAGSTLNLGRGAYNERGNMGKMRIVMCKCPYFVGTFCRNLLL